MKKRDGVIERRRINSGKYRTLASALLICFSFNFLFAGTKEEISRKIARLIEKGTVVLHDENGQSLISFHEDRVLLPASIIKILTAHIAMDVLGGNYRFKTEFYRDADNNLAIKGWGDPYLISEEIAVIAETLRQKGVREINRLYLDNSSFAPAITIPGVSKTSNPYDALNGALVVNFNTINITKDAKGDISSGEPETPLTPLAEKRAGVVKPGTRQRINLTDNRQDCVQYAGELFAVFFRNAGISLHNQTIGEIEVDRLWSLVHTHDNSRDLTTVIKGLMQYSNNFIANQIFLTLGALKRGYPATLENAEAVVTQYVREKMNIPAGQLMLCEGSGISRNNTMTGKTMIRILEAFSESAELLPLKYGALAKSGTLNGVHNYAGYIKTAAGVRPFVIMLNQKDNHRDTILKLLVAYCRD